MAAEALAQNGHDVAVFDQRRSPARKFVLAGRGGLNITHSESLDEFLDRYGPERAQLESAIRAFTPDDLRAWCSELGQDTFIGTSGRVFPEAFRAVPLLRSWLARLDSLGVSLFMQHRWLGFSDDGAWHQTPLLVPGTKGGRGVRFDAGDGEVLVECDIVVLALGGASWPKVGGDGSWVSILESGEIDVVPLAAANCGVEVEWSDIMVERFAGEPVKNSAVVVDGVAVRGDPIITKRGLEGGPIYAHSRRIRERLASGEHAISLDLFPDLDHNSLEKRLADREKNRDTTSNWLRRSGFSPVAASLLREATGNTIDRDAHSIAHLAKMLPLHVSAMANIDRAISSAGGVAWSEVDDNFQLKSMPGVYVVGEMLDWEAPTGGYLLQACMSTGRHIADAIGSA